MLGQMSGLLGNQQEEEQPTQMANTNQGVMSGLQGISNSMFKGMSQDEVYRMGLAFNTLRLEPDQNLAASYETRRKEKQTTDALTAQKNQTLAFLGNMKSDEFPMGRQDLMQMVSANLISPLDAIAEAREPKNTSAIQQRWRCISRNKQLNV